MKDKLTIEYLKSLTSGWKYIFKPLEDFYALEVYPYAEKNVDLKTWREKQFSLLDFHDSQRVFLESILITKYRYNTPEDTTDEEYEDILLYIERFLDKYEIEKINDRVEKRKKAKLYKKIID